MGILTFLAENAVKIARAEAMNLASELGFQDGYEGVAPRHHMFLQHHQAAYQESYRLGQQRALIEKMG